MSSQARTRPEIDFYFSFRSPYSYLALSQIVDLQDRFEVTVRMRVVRPLALRVPGFFKQVNPLWPPYVALDTRRIAERLQIPYAWPKPDPIVMDLSTGEVDEEQPYIHRISRMGAAAEELGKGLPFIVAAARLIWGGEVQDWHHDQQLSGAADEAGLDFGTLSTAAEKHVRRLDESIAANEPAQRAAGHWGVPLFVFNNEPFYGQDRIADLEWRLHQSAVPERSLEQSTR